jgi:hypothetical protein
MKNYAISKAIIESRVKIIDRLLPKRDIPWVLWSTEWTSYSSQSSWIDPNKKGEKEQKFIFVLTVR